MQIASFLQASDGSQRAPKNRYTQLEERVRRGVDNCGRSDNLRLLRAHLSWSYTVTLQQQDTFLLLTCTLFPMLKGQFQR
jgi:hypothetical protein